jgi:uncharacterized protein YbjT (DUF2867 family)
VLERAAAVVDVSNPPSFADDAVLEFFRTSTTNLFGYSAKAGVGHYVALSVVGTDRLAESGYFRAKIAQEKLIRESGQPYSIVQPPSSSSSSSPSRTSAPSMARSTSRLC